MVVLQIRAGMDRYRDMAVAVDRVEPMARQAQKVFMAVVVVQETLLLRQLVALAVHYRRYPFGVIPAALVELAGLLVAAVVVAVFLEPARMQAVLPAELAVWAAAVVEQVHLEPEKMVALVPQSFAFTFED